VGDAADHLPYDEVARVLDLIQDTGAVVVGGQSLAIWSRHYAERKPEIATVYSMSSQDVDFYGNRAAAELFAARLEQSKIYLPGPEDFTPHAAVVVGMVGDRKIQVDFMHSILGVTPRSIANNFVTLMGTHRTTGRPIRILVLHPLDCVRSRMSNINDLRRSDPHSLSSARASIVVLSAFIDDLLDQGLRKEAQSTVFCGAQLFGQAKFREVRIGPASSHAALPRRSKARSSVEEFQFTRRFGTA
jgi:hypothetical protein